MRAAWFAGAALLALAAPALAGNGTTTSFAAGRQAQPWRSLSTDARAAALAEASVAAGEDVQALRSNPAGLSLISFPQLAFTHNEWNSALGMRQEYLAYGRRLGNGGLGLALNYFSFGPLENRDAQGALVDTSTDAAYALSAGWGGGFLDESVNLGLGLEGGQQDLGGKTSAAYTLGLGGLYELRPGLTLGASYTGLGLSVEGGEAPSSLQLGLGWLVFSRSLGLYGQWTRPSLGESSTRLGAEWKLFGDYALRAGWRAAPESEPDRGFSAGAGAKLGAFHVDYAYVPYGELTRAHRVSLGLDLSANLFGGNIIIEASGVSQNAQAEYEDGKSAYEKRDWYVAKVALGRALKINPSIQNAAEIKGLLVEVDKKIAADRSRGMTSEQRERIHKRLKNARELSEEGELIRARRELEAVLEFDSQMKEALDLLKSVNARAAARGAQNKRDAVQALSQGDVVTAILKYRAVLKADDQDAEANAALRRLAPRVRIEAKKLHRQGIDAYVTADINGAIKFWERALELDPSDAFSIRRDLEKARKLKDLRTEK